MEDIYDLKEILFWFLYSIDYTILILSFLFFVFFYFTLNKFLSWKIDNIKIEEKPKVQEIKISQKDKFLQELKEIEENINNISNKIFFDKLEMLLIKLTFEIYKDKNIFNSTLKEIGENYNLTYFSIIEKCYYFKYSWNNDSLENDKKIELINDIKKVLNENI